MTGAALLALSEATWPPAVKTAAGPFWLRDGAGGGKRVSAASLRTDLLPAPHEIAAAEAAMAEPLFAVTPEQEAFDAALAARGYELLDPVTGYSAPVAELQAELPPLAAFAHWPVLQIGRDLWAEAGIGPGRLAVMERVRGPKTAILARRGNRSAGMAFVACDGQSAMLHALEVSPAYRRQGAGSDLIRAAANWAADQGAQSLSLVVLAQNSAARALYRALGMVEGGKYHYRHRPA